ncbi:hypothetical protein QBC45DRAFT_396362 [Copromyces sp. CBS 386.78]|nr:hypothetical protein QBC45DRAFT_396362 [Copromyces sp. CBS 386.78]
MCYSYVEYHFCQNGADCTAGFGWVNANGDLYQQHFSSNNVRVRCYADTRQCPTRRVAKMKRESCDSRSKMCRYGIKYRYCRNGVHCRGAYGLYGSPRRYYMQRDYKKRCHRSECRSSGDDLKYDQRLNRWVEEGD